MEARVNIAEGESTKAKYHSQKNKRKNSTIGSKVKNSKKIKGSCWVSEKLGHWAKDCRNKKKQNSGNPSNNKTSQANIVNI